MSVVDRELIAATVDAENSEKFSTQGTQTIMASATLVLDETVTIQQTHDGSSFQDCILNGVIQAIDKNHTMITILGPGQFRAVKSITANAVSVVLWETESET